MLSVLLIAAVLALNEPKPLVAESTVTLLELCHVRGSDAQGHGDWYQTYLIGWSRCEDGLLHHQWSLLVYQRGTDPFADECSDVERPLYFPRDNSVRFEIIRPYKIRFHNYRETWYVGSGSVTDMDDRFRPGLPDVDFCFDANKPR